MSKEMDKLRARPSELKDTFSTAVLVLDGHQPSSGQPTQSQLYGVLDDKSSSGRDNPWREKKINSTLVSESFRRLGDFHKADLVRWCGSFLDFRRYQDNSLKLHFANFCRIRLCPMCSWRRSRKIFATISKVMDELTFNNDYEFIFLTLTIKNVPGHNLSEGLNIILSGYNELFRLKPIKKAFLGALRVLEITHNTNVHSKSFDTFHPHLHCILIADKNYCKSKEYINKEKWIRYWRCALGAFYDPVIEVHKIQHKSGDFSKAVLEVSKYTLKDSDFLSDDLNFQDKTISILDSALKGRRLISFRGLFGKAFRNLKLDDPVDGDLVRAGDDELRPDLDYIVERYYWNAGYKQYILGEVNPQD